MATVQQGSKLDEIIERLRSAVQDQKIDGNQEVIKETLDFLTNCTRLKIGRSDVIVLDQVYIEKQNGHVVPASALNPDTFFFSEDSFDEGSKFVTTKEVADFFNVTQETVRDWIDKGLLTGVQKVKRGKYLIPREEFEFMKTRKHLGDDSRKQLMDKWFGENEEGWEIDYSNEDFDL